MKHFILTFPLDTEIFHDDVLNKRFEIARRIYNALVSVTQKRYKEMIKTIMYRSIKKQLSEIYKSNSKVNDTRKKELIGQLNALYKQFKLNEYAFHEDVKSMQHHFKTSIDSFTAQKIASRLWKAYESVLYGKGEKVHYKKYGLFNTLEGKSNQTGIRFKDGQMLWNGLTINVIVDENNIYENEALKNAIAYCRILRKFVRTKCKFYLQIVFKGNVPVKISDQINMRAKHKIGDGEVGLDIGTQTIAIASEYTVKIYELADRVQQQEDEKRRLLRKLDRSRGSNNPDNFNPDGTIKAQGSKKVVWVKSNRYKKTLTKLKGIFRKQADVRKLQHEILANEILSLGNVIYIETMNFEGLKKRAKKTEPKSDSGHKKRKRFGKSIANKAPSMLISIIERKLNTYGRHIIKIDTGSVKASQYNHTTGAYKKKKLSERWNEIDGKKIQRDMYSAFLIMNANDDLKSINEKKCRERFGNFVKLHDLEVTRLKGRKNLSSIAI